MGSEGHEQEGTRCEGVGFDAAADELEREADCRGRGY